MKNKFRQIIFAALMLLSFNTVFGQITLKVTSLINWPDTTHCYDVDSNIEVTIMNLDSTQSYSGDLSICVKPDTGSIVDTLVNLGYDSIQPLQTITLHTTFPYQFSPSAYVAGHDVVIVWPVSYSGQIIADSLHDSVFVICTAGIPEIPNNKAISLFPNPANDKLFFDSKYSINDMEYVRIMDVVGEEQSRFIPNENSIPIKNLSPGMYFIEVKLKDGTVITEKFIRE